MTHNEVYKQALEKYHCTERNEAEASLFYILTAVAGENYEKFLDDASEKEPGGVFIDRNSLDWLDSTGQYRLVKLAFHLFTGRDEYVVPEIDFGSFDRNNFEIALNAIRIRCGR